MGRNKYSVEERDAILKTFLRYTREIMESDGAEAVSTRKLAALTGYNSAKLYTYFKNIDDLVAMASVSYMEKYCKALAADVGKMLTAKDFLVHSWEVFCDCAFDEPAVYYRIFFGNQATPLQELMDEYYRLFPSQLEKLDENTRAMLKNGNIYRRSMITLEPLVEQGLLSSKRASVINELLVSYFKSMLEARMRGDGGYLHKKELCEKFMDALALLLEDLQ